MKSCLLGDNDADAPVSMHILFTSVPKW